MDLISLSVRKKLSPPPFNKEANDNIDYSFYALCELSKLREELSFIFDRVNNGFPEGQPKITNFDYTGLTDLHCQRLQERLDKVSGLSVLRGPLKKQHSDLQVILDGLKSKAAPTPGRYNSELFEAHVQ